MSTYSKWIEVDKDSILHNLNLIKQHTPNCHILGVVKTNAYGHDMVQMSKLIEPHVQCLGVGHGEEGISLRKNNITKSILILSPYFDEEQVLDYHLTPSIDSIEKLDILYAMAQKHNIINLPFHLKINTGMNRFGLNPSEIHDFCLKAKEYESNLLFEGVYSHFATTMKNNKEFTLQQLHIFKDGLEVIQNYFPTIPYVHMANSKAIIDLPESHFNMVRAGNLMYGKIVDQTNIGFKTAFTAKARVMDIRELPKGSSLGYGATFKVTNQMRVGIISVGTYDGFLLGQQSVHYSFTDSFKLLVKSILKKENPKVFLNGKSVPLVGKVSTQFSFIDLTSFPDVKVGDTVNISLPIFSAKEDIPRVYI